MSSTDDAGIRATFLRQVGNCPSGRLVAWDGSTERPVEQKLPTSIELVEDPEEDCSGPIWLRGKITLVSADGSAYRNTQSGDRVPLRSIREQALLRRHARQGKISFQRVIPYQMHPPERG